MKTNDVATRRRFFFGAGAAALAAPPIAFALAAPDESASDQEARDALAARVAAFEDANAIRELQRAYAKHLNANAQAAAAELFTDPAHARFDATIRELAAAAAGADASIEIAPDRATATARQSCIVRIEAPIEAPGCALVDMARAQGEGVVRYHERRSLEQTFVRRGGVWKIERSAVREPS